MTLKVSEIFTKEEISKIKKVKEMFRWQELKVFDGEKLILTEKNGHKI